MLVEMAVADAYAIAWEFTEDQKAENDLTGFHQHPTYLELKPGQYTDDTQRAIGNIRVLIGPWDPSVVFNPLSYAKSYVDTYKGDPRDGYSRGFQALLNSVDSGLDLLRTVKRNRASNGSLMGAAPFAFIKDIADLKLASMIQAISTHHPSSVVHAQIVALAGHYFLDEDMGQRYLLEYVDGHIDWVTQEERQRWLGEVMAFGMDPFKKTTIKASSISAYMVSTVMNAESLTQIMRDAVRRGGDTDSAAATTTAIASLSPDIENDIPKNLIDDLDVANPGFGVQYLESLDQDLRKWFNS